MRVARTTRSFSGLVGASGICRASSFSRTSPHLAAAAQSAPRDAAVEFGDPLQYLLRTLATRSDGIRVAAAYYTNEIKPRLRQRMNETASARVQDADTQRLPEVDVRVLSSLAQSRWQEFAILLMKILCDAKRLEDVRLLFALCLRETWTPKTDVFSVLLMGISSSDTFTEDEVDQVWALMKERGVERDVVCDVCFLHLYLRLGRTEFERQQWPSIRDRIQGTLIRHMSDPRQHLLPVGFTTKLSHCFTVLTRASCHQDHPWELLAILEPFRSFRTRSAGAIGSVDLLPSHVVLTATQLLTFLSLSLNNEEVTSRQLRLLFESLVHQYDHEYRMFHAPSSSSAQHHNLRRPAVEEKAPSESQGSSSAAATTVPPDLSNLPTVAQQHHDAVVRDESEINSTSRSIIVSDSNNLSSSGSGGIHALQLMFQTASAIAEFNLFRLLSRCIRDVDFDFAQTLATYARERSAFSNSETKSIFFLGLVQVHALAATQSNRPRHERMEHLQTLLHVLDEECVEQHCSLSALSSALTVVTPSFDGTAQHSILVSSRMTASVLRVALTHGGEELLLEVTEKHMSAAATNAQVTSSPTWRSIVFLVDALGCLGCKSAWESLLSRAWKTCGLAATAEVYEAMGCAMLENGGGGGAVCFSSQSDPLGQWLSLVENMVRTNEDQTVGLKVRDGNSVPLCPTPAMLANGLRFAVSRGDVTRAMKIVRLHVECGAPMNRVLIGPLARQLCYVVDLEAIQTLLDAAETLNGGAEPAVKNMCAKVVAKYGHAARRGAAQPK